MNLTSNSYLFLVVSELSHKQKAQLAAVCARIALNLQRSMSLPVSLQKFAVLEEVVCLTEKSANEGGDMAELSSRMQYLRGFVFGSSTQSRFPNATVIFHVARSVYAAGLAAITGYSGDVQDALEAAFAAAQTAESKQAEDSLWGELRRILRAARERETAVREQYIACFPKVVELLAK
jgi:hypothetical protein